MRSGMLLLLLVVLTLVQPAPAAPGDLSAAVEGNNELACDLYGRLSRSEGNVIVSPYSLSTALAMTYAGARGVTEQEMAEVLHFDLGQDRQHAAFETLLKDLASAVDAGPVNLWTANSLWAQQDYRFLPEFLELATTKYDAHVFLVDFVHAAEVARRRINGWADEATQGTIKDLIPAGLLTPLTRLVLCNAIYFKAPWRYRFDPGTTSDAPFYLTPDSSIAIPMMSQRASFKLWEGDGFRLGELPYGGGDFSMVIILPDAGISLATVERQMTPEHLAHWLADLDTARPHVLSLMLPRFTMTARFELADTLAAMGMPHAFQGADFSGMTGRRDLFISNVIHKAFIEVTEEGTEASAATAVVMKRGGGPASFVANHPFCFLIRDRGTGSILFLGRVADPSVPAAG